jgi:C4-dicarboxylate-specific signal transduction histidine kinase
MPVFHKVRNWPIQRKLLLIILSTIAVSLVLVMAGIVTYELATYRNRMSQEVSAVGDFIAANSAPTLAFDDAQTAREILVTLRGSPSIAIAALYSNDGRVLASYVRAGQPIAAPPSPGPEGTRFAGHHLELVRSIQKKGRRLGMLYLRADGASVSVRLTSYAGIFLAVSVALGAGAILLQRLLKRLVAPLLRLSRMAERVADGDLAIQVPVESADEIGQLAGSFNHMTSELAHSYAELEMRVQDRTEKLTRALRELRAETDERIHAVEELRKREQMLIQQSRMAAMGEMLGNISHQWRQPLNVLGLKFQELGLSYKHGRFSEDLLYGNIAKAMEIIHHMSQTISVFQDYLKPNKEKTLFSVNEIVAKTVSLIEENFENNAIHIEIISTGDPQVEGFPNEYGQVLLNLLVNARDSFLERGVASAQITVRSWAEQGRVITTVTDNAGGIGEEIIDKIFDAYFTTKELGKGIGVGLFMSKNIIEHNMGGILSVRNVKGGAEFKIEV